VFGVLVVLAVMNFAALIGSVAVELAWSLLVPVAYVFGCFALVVGLGGLVGLLFGGLVAQNADNARDALLYVVVALLLLGWIGAMMATLDSLQRIRSAIEQPQSASRET
jgi:hypothetical protein